MQPDERRQYLRGAHFHCIAKLSIDQKNWKESQVYDLSSGGLKLRTTDEYAPGAILWFDLNIQGFMSEFSVKVQGVIRRKDVAADYFLYGIAFVGLSQELQVRIDENILGDRPIQGDTYSQD